MGRCGTFAGRCTRCGAAPTLVHYGGRAPCLRWPERRGYRRLWLQSRNCSRRMGEYSDTAGMLTKRQQATPSMTQLHAGVQVARARGHCWQRDGCFMSAAADGGRACSAPIVHGEVAEGACQARLQRPFPLKPPRTTAHTASKRRGHCIRDENSHMNYSSTINNSDTAAPMGNSRPLCCRQGQQRVSCSRWWLEARDGLVAEYS